MSDALNAISDYAEPAQLQAALETLSDEIAGKLQLPATAIGDVLSGQYERAMKGIRTVQGKILKQLGTHSVEIDNLLDPSATAILQSLNTATAEIEWLLQSAAVKGGMLGVGDRLTPEAIAQMGAVPEQMLGSTLVLQLGELRPVLLAIVEVLGEIRDRMPALPVRLPDETPTLADQAEESQPQWSDPVSVITPM